MRINSKDLLSLPVETKSGERLGKVASFEIDCETHLIANYYVRSLKDLLFKDELIISPSQVISINKEKMIVEDAVIKDKIKDVLNIITPVNLE